MCTLPPGVCAIQRTEGEPNGKARVVCTQPHCVLADWQMVDVEKLPLDEVRNFMTADPVMVESNISIAELAKMMVDAHIHRVIVVDGEQRPIGIVASTDVLNAVGRAHAEDDP